MTIEEALRKEIKYLDDLELSSLRYAETKGDIRLGSWYRSSLKDRVESYKRILKSLDSEQT